MSRFRAISRFLIRAGSVLLIFALSACSKGETQTTTPETSGATASAAPSAVAIASPTSIPPSPTSEPLAARVNDASITLAEYQAELALYQASTGEAPSAEAQQRVLDDLIDQTLLAVAAAEQGFLVDESMLQTRIDNLVIELGSEGALNDWISAHGYTEESFRAALARAVAAAWMRDQIAADVPKSAEQVHARQILLYDAVEANQVLAQLEAGNDFGNLAAKYDPVTKGDLGWFPRGYLPDARLEEVAFNLAVDQFSQVIETLAGFHILQVIERDPDRPLDQDALLTLQYRALQEWLEARRNNSRIEILAPISSVPLWRQQTL